MKEKTNPLRWLMYLAVICLFLDIGQIYLDAATSGEGDILGIPFHSRGALNPTAPFRIACILVFLYFYRRHSKYAWHTLMVIILLDIPAYWILRWQGIYFKVPETGISDWFTLSLWVFLLVYVIKLRSAYVQFILCDNVQTRKAQQATPDNLLAPYQITGSSENKGVSDPSRPPSLSPGIQIQLGKLGAAFVLIYSTYHIIIHKFYLAIVAGIPAKFVTVFVVCSAFGYAVPIVYLCGLVTKRLAIARTVYRIWLVFVLGFLLFIGLEELVLKGDFSAFLSFWMPLGIVTILWQVGLQGLTRIMKPEATGKWFNTASSILMFIGMFLGFFCGGKITHDFLASYWPDIPHYDRLRWMLPCFTGAVAGSSVGAYVGAFIGSLIDQLRKGKPTKREDQI